MKINRLAKLTSLFLVIFIISSMCISCSIKKYIDTTFIYDKSWIIGKNSNEIQERYGIFDIKGEHQNENGLFYSTSCGYYTQHGDTVITIQRFFDSPKDEKLIIVFDANGIAIRILTRVLPKGG